MSHHVTLSFDKDYLNNTMSNFYCVLAEPLSFSTKYEVAITEIYYPVDYTVPMQIELQIPTFYKIQNANIASYYDNGVDYDQDAENIKIDKTKKVLENDYAKSVSELKSIVNVYSKQREYESLKLLFYAYEKTIAMIHDTVKRYPILIDLLTHAAVDVASIGSTLLHYKKQLNLSDQEDYLFHQCELFIYSFKKLIDEIKSSSNDKVIKIINFPDRCSSTMFYDIMFKNLSACLFTNRQKSQFIVKPFIAIRNEKNNIFLINDKKITVKRKEFIPMVKHFVIYTNIIEDNLVFNTLAPVLKIIKPEGIYSDYICKTFDNPHYLHVNKTFISSILIQIKDQDLNFVQFNPGSFVIKLHFRPVKK
jgi:hypothetical protein